MIHIKNIYLVCFFCKLKLIHFKATLISIIFRRNALNRAASNLIDGLSIIKGLPLINKDMNEAQTRFDIIDNILRALGWNDYDFTVEENVEGKYADYILGKPRKLIVEAKRIRRLFELPVGSNKKLLQPIDAVMRLSDEAKDGIKQVQKYCSDCGVKNAVLTNGHQFIAFIATRDDGLSPFEGKCFVIDSIQTFIDNFEKIWQLLSPDAIKEQKLQRYLSTGEIKIPAKLSSRLASYPKYRSGSDLHNTLKTLAELLIQDVFEDETTEQTFITNCYCESGALSQHSLLSKNIMAARYSSLFDTNEAKVPLHDVNKRKKQSSNIDQEIITEAISKRPIVLLGDVGVGKTSFIKNLQYNSAYEEFSKAVFINIDLGSGATLSDNLSDYILQELEDQLYDNYGIQIDEEKFVNGVYSKEIQKFSNSIYGVLKDTDISEYNLEKRKMLLGHLKKKDEHIKKSISYASKELKKQVIIVIDNADQRDFETQQNAFLVSQELAHNWDAIVFVSVRPKTFFHSKRYGALSAYPNKIFIIKPPKIEDVITKRLRYAIKLADGSLTEEDYRNFQLRSENLVAFLKALLYSLDENKELTEFIANITGGNVRQAIDIVIGFIGSPNVDAERVINEMEKNDSYFIQLHEFSRSVLLGDLYHYSDDRSLAMNIYDVKYPDQKEHFLKPLIISYLNSDVGRKDNDGFVETFQVIEEMLSHGFHEDQIKNSIIVLVNKKLIETNKRITFDEVKTNSKPSVEIDFPKLLRSTSTGVYHVDKWSTSFVYLDSISHDTPIFNKKVFDELLPDLEVTSLIKRNNRAKIIRDYLTETWNSSDIKSTYYDFNLLTVQWGKTFEFVQHACDKQVIHAD